MQFGELFCYALLTITITATIAEENEENDIIFSRKISKRETSLILDGYQSKKSVKQQPRMVYRKISSQRFRKPSHVTPKSHNSKRHPPKYEKPSQPSRQYSSRHKNYKTKYNYGRGKQLKTKNSYHNAQKIPQNFLPHPFNLPSGFGEPPRNFEEFTPKINFAEPPDYVPNKQFHKTTEQKSHNVPFIHGVNPFLSPQTFPPRPNRVEEDNKYDKETRQWQSYLKEESDDSNHAFTKKQVAYSNPTIENDYEHIPLKSYSDVYNYGNPKTHFSYEGKQKKYGDKNKFLNRPWVSMKVPIDEQEIVGGLYAEPPARIVSKLSPSVSMAAGDGVEPQMSAIDHDDPYSGTISPYVNYKHSNMAFSPQNLNDAFNL